MKANNGAAFRTFEDAAREQNRQVVSAQIAAHARGDHNGEYDRHAGRGCPQCQEWTGGSA